jgi:cytohesin
VNLQDEEGNTPLHYAVMRQNVELVHKLLRTANADPHITNHNGETPLHLHHGNVHTTSALLEAGAQPNVLASPPSTTPSDPPRDSASSAVAIVPDDKQTPLLAAVAMSATDVVTLLLEHGARPDLQSSTSGVAPLHIACANEDIAGTEALLRAGANPNLIEGTEGWSPLHFAVQRKSLYLVQRLLSSGADVNARGPRASHFSTIYLACALRAAPIVAELLRRGASSATVNWVSSDGLTALLVSIKNGDIGIVHMLMQHGADALTISRSYRPAQPNQTFLSLFFSSFGCLTRVLVLVQNH